MINQIHVKDNFYKDPDAIRDFALNHLHWLTDERQIYAGKQTETNFFNEDLIKNFENISSKKFLRNPKNDVFGAFRLSTKSDKAKTNVHFDSADWSALIYLTPQNDEKNGTLFFKHKKTGLIGPKSDSDKNDCSSKIISTDSLNEDAWEELFCVPYKYNRLILFRSGLLFHSAGASFGDSMTNGRLTQNFFLREQNGEI